MLQAWADAPARFREDANTEEDFALGGYRDRLIVELAQNAADAASRAGIPGVLSISWDGSTLSAANTGVPLDSDGVIALSSLRASAKSGGTVGRFGVGFSAVLAVCEEPQVISRTGGICFSASRTRAEAEKLPALAAELARRSGQVPALRLPWPCEGAPPAGFDTEVRLPVRPEMRSGIDDLLADVPAELLLSLRGLSELRIGERVITRAENDGIIIQDGQVSTTWQVSTVDGQIPAALLADRPTEERWRDRWEITWAVPVDSAGTAVAPPGAAVLHAPTASDQPVSVPARLIATIPLDPDRRHVAAGGLTDYLIERAGELYADFVQALPAGPERLRLVPQVHLSADAVDGALVESCLRHLRSAKFLSTMECSRLSVLERDIAAAAPALADVIDGLLDADWSAVGYEPPLRSLGVRRLSAVDIVDVVSTVERPAEWWGELYAGLQNAADRDALAGLPVPLVDGRMVTGARGAFLIDGAAPAALDVLGLRVIAPAAAHSLLERLGARPATAFSLLEEDVVQAAVAESFDAPEPEAIAEAVLDLVSIAEPDAGELPWLAELALPGADGEWYPAGEMLLPGSPLAAVVAADAPYGRPEASWVERWGAETLCAVGVLRTFPVIRAAEIVPGEGDLELPDESAWFDAIEARLPESDLPATLAEVAAVGDLDLVADWPKALALLAAEPLRSVVSTPVVAGMPDGARIEVPSYTSWWLSTHPVLDGRRPAELTLPATVLAGLYDVTDVDPELAGLLGVRSDLAEVLADPDAATGLLYRLADPKRTADPELLRGIYRRLAAVLRDFEVDPPAGVRTASEQVADREDVIVLDLPYAAPLLDGVPVGGDAAVADLLDVPLASHLVAATVDSQGSAQPWAEMPGARLAAYRCGGVVPAGVVLIHSPLRVNGRSVPWWPEGERDHVDGAAASLGRALAWRLGRWDRRAAAAEAFAHPDAEWPALEDSLEA